MNQRLLVTAALPYANGSLHIGHLVEYCQADIYVRALKRLGEDAIYICASDAHGTPIELNAARQRVAPKTLVERIHDEQLLDFTRFDVSFDWFSSTHSETNRELVESVYATLQAQGDIDIREVDGTWCEHDSRFLPDRFVRGTCPNPDCGASDQYGDVCEVCNTTYSPTDLRDPRCAICNNPPITKKSEHAFFKLSDAKHVAFLRKWIDSGSLQEDVANYVRTWIEEGLRDWDITRDGPYWGFAIPDRPNQYFYVWLDAPLGYVASSQEWGAEHDASFDDLWRSPDKTRIEHIIGKDIVYFHTLFWPAVLNAIGYTLPSGVYVHGMLTVDGEKMSKSRGTFINASVFADHVDPQALRYYYACKYSPKSDDLDLSLDDLVLRVNGELVNKHANLFSRAVQFVNKNLDGRLGDLPFSAGEAQAEPTGDDSMLDLARRVVAGSRRVETLYRERDFGRVVRELSAIADIGNEYIQAQMPWDQMKTDPEAARQTLTFALNVCHALAMYLWPIVPRFADTGARLLGSTIERMDATTLFGQRQRKLGTFERMFERIDSKVIEAMVDASKESLSKTRTDDPDAAAGTEIAIEQFQALDLRVGVVEKAEPVKKSKKLLRLEVDIGEAAPRQLVAGIAQSYSPDQLVGSRVVVVANLRAATLMGVESRGMVLAAGKGDQLSVLHVDRDLPPGTRVS